VLIVVKDRYFHPVAQLALDIKTLGRLDIFQVDATEGRFQRCNDVAQLVWIGLIDFDIEHIDTGKFFEQYALAFHYRLRCERTDIAQAEYGCAVGDDRDQVSARGVFEGVGRIGDDFFTSNGHAWRVRQG
jgi:hypothetical protein